jgi:hypothetical protein
MYGYDNDSGIYCTIIWLKTALTIRGSGLLVSGLPRGQCTTYFDAFTPWFGSSSYV